MGSKNQTSTTNSNQTYTPAALSNLQDIYSKAASAASTPYTPYTGQLTAGLTDTQQNAITGANNAAGIAQPYYQQAGQLVSGAANPLTASQIQNYMNPYTQSVIDATQANFNEDNGQQQQQVIGNAAMKGALGGDRVGVAQAELARQQQLAQAPVIAGLQQQGYTQALQTAQQQYQQNPLQAAAAYGTIGTGAQNAAEQGVQGQLTAGGVQQQTNQTGLTNDYQQYLQALAYPYQNAQFLASIGIPASGAMGGTTVGSGTSTQPGPSPFAQIAGLGLSAASLFSDKRVKDDIETIGKTFDGQKIYKFRYKNDPVMRIGLMAQDVEKTKPNAVGKTDGIKTVDYDAATEDAADKGHFASGGAVTPFDFINDARGYVPKPVSISGGDQQTGSGPSASMGSAGAASKPIDNLAPITSGLSGLKGALGGASYGGGNIFSDAYGGSSSSPLEGLSAADYGAGFADGGAVDNLDDRFAPVLAAINDGTFDPQGANYTPFTPPAVAPSPIKTVPVSASPMVAAAQPDDTSLDVAPAASSAPPVSQSLPPQITGPQDDSALPDSSLAYSGTSPLTAPVSAPVATTDTEHTMGGWNPFNLSDKARAAIIAGGLGIAASRSPFALTAIGEGGLQGVKSYSDMTKAEQEAAEKRITQAQNQQRIDQEAKRIAQNAEQFAKTYGLFKLKTENELDPTPDNFEVGPDGKLQPVAGGPADPAYLKSVADAKRLPGLVMDDDTANFLADRVLVGDTRALIGLGRGAQGAENIAKIQTLVAQKARAQGIDPTDILAKVAEQSGNMAAQRTFGNVTTRMAINTTEAQGAIELGRAASAAVPRTNWVPVNKAIQAYQAGTSDPALAKFGAANLAIINTYARAISPTGVPTVNDKQHAEHLLSTASGPDAYNAVLDQMNAEIKIAHAAAPKAKKEMEDIRKGRAPTSDTSALAPITKTLNGKTYVQRDGQWYAQ